MARDIRTAGEGPHTAIVVGGGIMGLSTAWALARRGVRVELFDQGPLPNPLGSSYDEHRMNRHAYGRLDGYARLMPAAFRMWDELWAAIGARHYEATGGLYVLREEDGWYEATTRQLDAMDIGWSELTVPELSARFPMLKTNGVTRAVRVEGSGMLFPVPILNALLAHLASIGVRLSGRVEVTAIDAARGIVVADGRTREADAVVVATGAWIDRLVPGLRGVAVPSRQAVMFLAPPAEFAPAWASAPTIVVRHPDCGVYCLPPHRGTRLKIGDHRFSRIGDPDEDRRAGEADVERLREGLRMSFEGFKRYTVLEQRACYYTVTEDEGFILQPLGERGWAVSACSGHGFKLGPLVGDGVARAVMGEADAASVAAWLAGKAAAEPRRAVLAG